eukprot:5811416-Amphidinium_carterae.1
MTGISISASEDKETQAAYCWFFNAGGQANRCPERAHGREYRLWLGIPRELAGLLQVVRAGVKPSSLRLLA